MIRHKRIAGTGAGAGAGVHQKNRPPGPACRVESHGKPPHEACGSVLPAGSQQPGGGHLSTGFQAGEAEDFFLYIDFFKV